MSGPLSSSEIEDVVSSVRRLVSTDQRPRPVSRDLRQDKLLLTPALRVVAENPLIEPLILTEQAPDSAPEALWEDQIWSQPEPPLAELALGAEEAEVITPWPEAANDPAPWTEAEWDESPQPDAERQDDLDVAEMLTAAVVEDEAFRHLSEDELQDLVRTMVREELQGSLGERITRNVRKLVRAEINRALAAQSLD